MKHNVSKAKPSFFRILACAALALLATGFCETALAQVTVSSTIDASCTKMSTFGFTAGIVYCVQASIGKATAVYVAALQKNLLYYEGMAAAVAIAMFGIKMMNSNVQQPMKDTMTLGFRILIGVFFFSSAGLIYPTIAGTLPQGGGIINQAIGWVTGINTSNISVGGVNTGVGAQTWGQGTNTSTMSTTLFGQLISANCHPDPVPSGSSYNGIQIWQAFDCMFAKLMGAVNPGTHPVAFATSLLVIAGAALFSGTMGVTVVVLILSMFLGALLLIFRALFMVLMAYICVGFLAIFAPLIAPLIFFESKYLTEKFKRWLGLITTTIFQPVFVIGFLAMAITIDDQIIEGNLPMQSTLNPTGCKLPTYPPDGATGKGPQPDGWGQDGSGVCSFTQLFYRGKADGDISLAAVFNSMMEHNSTMFNWAVGGDPQAHPPNVNVGTLLAYYDPTVAADPTNTVPGTNTTADSGGKVGATTTRLKKFAPIKQMILTAFTFIFTTFVMLKLLEIIPKMAAEMTIMVGLNLAQTLQVPFEAAIRRGLSGAETGSQEAAAKSRNVFNGALKGFGQGMVGTRTKVGN